MFIDAQNALGIIVFAIVVLVVINVLSCSYALGRFHAWKKDRGEG